LKPGSLRSGAVQAPNYMPQFGALPTLIFRGNRAGAMPRYSGGSLCRVVLALERSRHSAERCAA